jgi:hypothetical protein
MGCDGIWEKPNLKEMCNKIDLDLKNKNEPK